MSIQKTKIAISVCAVLLAVAHLIWPGITIDTVTLVLILVAILPWLASVIKSVELPGGVKIELADVQSATQKVTSDAGAGEDVTSEVMTENVELLHFLALDDANSALVGLRIEIEKRLYQIAKRSGLQVKNRSAGALLRILRKNGVIEGPMAGGLEELIMMGNQAAHGAQVAPNAVNWAVDEAPSIFRALEHLQKSIQSG